MILYKDIIEYCSATKKNKILPFAKIWMDLGGIMLCEISQGKTNTLLTFSCRI